MLDKLESLSKDVFILQKEARNNETRLIEMKKRVHRALHYYALNEFSKSELEKLQSMLTYFSSEARRIDKNIVQAKKKIVDCVLAQFKN